MWIDIHCHKIESPINTCLIQVFPFGQQPIDITIYGLHPWHIQASNYQLQLQQIFQVITHNSIPIIGEIGLDKACEVNFDLQKKVLEAQLKFSSENQLPCIIHGIRSYAELLAYRKAYPTPFWLIHDFNSSPQMAQELISKRCYLSFGQRIFQTNSRAYHGLKQLEAQYFFLETDVQSNYNIQDIYREAAQIKNIDLHKLQEIQYQNFLRVFGHISGLRNQQGSYKTTTDGENNGMVKS